MHDDELARRVAAIEWHHSINLRKGIVTPGAILPSDYLTAPELPGIQGGSVLDIGARDGYYSFKAERLGASRVVALEHDGWGTDRAARLLYWRRCVSEGQIPDYLKDVTEFWRDELPGRRGFDLACQVFQSKVEPMVADFGRMELATLGTFSVVLFIDGLHRVKDPMRILKRVRSVTRRVAVIESEAAWMPYLGGQPFFEFLGGQVSLDAFRKWYVPTIEALCTSARRAGFRSVEVLRGPPMESLNDPVQTAGGGSAATDDGRREDVTHYYRAAILAYV
jgi:tRNA (mo5U34)-methyltransferase